MALEVASIIDESVINPEWAETSCATLNRNLSVVKVTPGYSVIVTIADRNYLLSSDASGKLSVTVLPGLAATKAMSRAQCRLVLDADALEISGQELRVAELLAKRKMRCEGDSSRLKALENELAPHLAMLRESVDAVRPSEHVIKMAIEEYNSQLYQIEAQQRAEVNDAEALQLSSASVYYPDEQPLLMGISSWLLFSAGSQFNGNPGQTNYAAANGILDAMTFSMRTTNCINFDALTLMWGAVGGIGMRWKAFASQDFLEGLDVLFSVEDARKVLMHMMNGVAPEWTCAQLVPKSENGSYLESFSILTFQTTTGRRHSGNNPWVYERSSMGKGGGLCLESSQPATLQHKRQTEQKDSQESWLFPGRRVRVHGLAVNSEMNGAKGTLIEELEPRIWHVRLDDDMGEKLLKVENMMQVHSSMVKPQPQASASPKAALNTSPTPMSIAGNWDSWMPHDMQWDNDSGCYTFTSELNGTAGTYFGINRGSAGSRPWRPGSFKKWCVGQVSGSHKIKVFVKDGKVSDVKWEPCP